MIRKIQRWGDSLAVRIPDGLAKEARVENGTHVDLTVKAGCIVLVPISSCHDDLKSLLDLVTRRNMHAEVDFGERTGKEAW